MFDRWFDSYRWWWCALSGILLVASFAPFSCAACGWIALVPTWWVLTRSERVRLRPFRHGYLVGLVYFGGVFWWISNVTAIGTFFLVLYLALYPAVWFQLVIRFLPRREGSVDILFRAMGAASLWVVLEWWRGWFLTGFNWNELGISQAPSIAFRQLAAYGGVHLISFVLVLVNVLWAEGVLGIAQTLRAKRVVRPGIPFGMALVIVAGGFAVGWHHLQRHRGEGTLPALSFACVQPNIPQIPYDGGPYAKYAETEKEALDSAYKLSGTAESGPTKPDLLIWPEAFTGQEIFRQRQMNQIVHDIASSSGRYFLVGSQDSEVEGPKIYNCAYLFGPGWDSFQYYRKTQLVILGEWLPFGDTFPILRKWAGVGMDFTPGPGPVRFEMKAPALTFAPLICFEDTMASVADKAAALKPDFFVTITNDGWYTGWSAAWGVRQHLNHSIFRCIEHDRPMIRCANTGISCTIDQNGTVTNRFLGANGAEIDVGGVFARTVTFYPTHGTLYELWGDWIILISSLVSLMLGLRFVLRTAVRLRMQGTRPI